MRCSANRAADRGTTSPRMDNGISNCPGQFVKSLKRVSNLPSPRTCNLTSRSYSAPGGILPGKFCTCGQPWGPQSSSAPMRKIGCLEEFTSRKTAVAVSPAVIGPSSTIDDFTDKSDPTRLDQYNSRPPSTKQTPARTRKRIPTRCQRLRCGKFRGTIPLTALDESESIQKPSEFLRIRGPPEQAI